LTGQTVSRGAASPAIDAAPRPRTVLGVVITLAAAAAFALANTSADATLPPLASSCSVNP